MDPRRRVAPSGQDAAVHKLRPSELRILDDLREMIPLSAVHADWRVHIADAARALQGIRPSWNAWKVDCWLRRNGVHWVRANSPLAAPPPPPAPIPSVRLFNPTDETINIPLETQQGDLEASGIPIDFAQPAEPDAPGEAERLKVIEDLISDALHVLSVPDGGDGAFEAHTTLQRFFDDRHSRLPSDARRWHFNQALRSR
jgi:hypothetical protein